VALHKEVGHASSRERYIPNYVYIHADMIAIPYAYCLASSLAMAMALNLGILKPLRHERVGGLCLLLFQHISCQVRRLWNDVKHTEDGSTLRG
jgi:hypothetical protein